MKEEIRFGYTVLRYVFDIATQEFINVGVLVYSPETRCLKFHTSKEVARLKALFPEMENQKNFKALISQIQDSFDDYSSELRHPSQSSLPEEVMAAATKILPRDSSALQWSPAAGGLTDDLDKKSQALFERFVTRHSKKSSPPKTTTKVLKPFKRTLLEKNLWHRISSVSLNGLMSEHTFDHSWKNGFYHCFQPVVFDQKTSAGIEAKVHEWVGLVRDLEHSEIPHKIHLLAGEPELPSLKTNYHQATEAMSKLLGNKAEIIKEDNIPLFSERIAKEMLQHAV